MWVPVLFTKLATYGYQHQTFYRIWGLFEIMQVNGKTVTARRGYLCAVQMTELFVSVCNIPSCWVK